MTNDKPENPLVALEKAGLPQKYSDDTFEATTKAGNFLPRLQLMTSSSKAVKKNVVPPNNYAVIDGQEFTTVGEEVDCLIVAWRPKALKIAEVIISNFDPNSDQFKSIQEESEEKDSGCMFGPEFLLYLPIEKKFVGFYMGSKSARRVSKQVKALMHKPATLKSQFIETKQYSWYTPAISKCSTPFDIPKMQVIEEEVARFNNPPASDVEESNSSDGEVEHAR